MVTSSKLVRLFLGLFLFVFMFLSSKFLTTLCYHSGVFFLLFCIFAVLNPCMGSQFPIVYAKDYLVFQSANNSYWPKTAISPVLIIKKYYLEELVNVRVFFLSAELAMNFRYSSGIVASHVNTITPTLMLCGLLNKILSSCFLYFFTTPIPQFGTLYVDGK